MHSNSTVTANGSNLVSKLVAEGGIVLGAKPVATATPEPAQEPVEATPPAPQATTQQDPMEALKALLGQLKPEQVKSLLKDASKPKGPDGVQEVIEYPAFTVGRNGTTSWDNVHKVQGTRTRTGTNKQYGKVFGKYSVVNTLHFMGERRWDKATAVAVLAKLGITDVNPATVTTALTDGRNPKYNKQPAWTAEEVATLLQYHREVVGGAAPVATASPVPTPEAAQQDPMKALEALLA